MKRIERADYLQLLASTEVVERDGYGEKVLARPDGLLVKIFRRKRWLTTALLTPYALRFVRNARKLTSLGIATVQVVDVGSCPAMQRHLVTYRPLPGKTLRRALGDDAAGRPSLLAEFGRFVAALHEKGVYFRSLHFGNVIVPTEGHELGLIDVADLSFCRGALPVRLRARNFRHMLRYQEDIGFISEYGGSRFLDGYLAAAGLPVRDRERLAVQLDNLPVKFSP